MVELSDTDFQAFADLMHGSVGLSLPAHKKALVASRIGPRLQRLQMGGYKDYLQRIRSDADPGEFQVAVDLLTTHETYFFREPKHFEVLRQELSAGPARRVAGWSAACSYGDEPYSLAMLLADLAQQGRIEPDWSLLATDVAEQVLREAREAIYPESRFREVPQHMLRRWCLRGEGEAEGLVALRPEIVSRVDFGLLNLCQPIDVPGPFDFIFLRNVLIYFDAPTKAAVVSAVVRKLRTGGLFFIGTAEGRLTTNVPMQAVAPGVYRRVM